MASRFDNLPTDELVGIEATMRRELRELHSLIRRRFEAESPVEIGKAYKIRSGRFRGRTMKLLYVVVNKGLPVSGDRATPFAEGVLNQKSGWTLRTQQTALSNLDTNPIDEE